MTSPDDVIAMTWQMAAVLTRGVRRESALTLSLPRVINFKLFSSAASPEYNITQYEELDFS